MTASDSDPANAATCLDKVMGILPPGLDEFSWSVSEDSTLGIS